MSLLDSYFWVSGSHQKSFRQWLNLGDAHGEESQDEAPHVAKLRRPLQCAADRPTNPYSGCRAQKRGWAGEAIMAIMLPPGRQLPAELETRWWRIGWFWDRRESIDLPSDLNMMTARRSISLICNSDTSGSHLQTFDFAFPLFTTYFRLWFCG